MPVLPSGIVVDIVEHRARYHALRQRRRITARTPHVRLYSLIDIVYPDTNASPSQWSKYYSFTGHTLDDLHWLNKWRAEDRRFFLDWVQEDAQVRVIDQARRRLLAEPGSYAPEVVIHPYHEAFYSELYRRIRALTMTKATPEHWQQTLARMQQQGIRAEELAWSGLPDYIRQQQALGTQRLYRDELASRIDFRHIRVELTHERVTESTASLNWVDGAMRLSDYCVARLGLPAARRALLQAHAVLPRHSECERAYHIGQLHPLGAAIGSEPSWFVLEPFGTLVGTAEGKLHRSREIAVELANQHARESQRLPAPPSVPTHNYDYVTLHGGESYREWLVTLPDYQRSHFTGHYLERNVLMHMRTKERTDTQGRRLLFIEEIQSDWHQAALRYGYDNRFDGTVPVAPYRKEWCLLGLKLLLAHAVKHDLDGLAWTSGQQQEQRYGRPMPPIARLYDQTIPNHLQRLARPWQATPTTTRIATLDPWLQAWRKSDKWYVKSADNRFHTRPNLEREQAKRLIECHSRPVELEVPMLLLPQAMRTQIAEDSLPLFGDWMKRLDPH